MWTQILLVPKFILGASISSGRCQGPRHRFSHMHVTRRASPSLTPEPTLPHPHHPCVCVGGALLDAAGAGGR